MVASGRNSNSSETLKLSLLLARMKETQSKMKAMECSQHYTLPFRRTRAGNSIVCLKFKLIQAFMHVLVTCKNEDDSIKNEWARVVTTFFPLLVYWDFSRCSRADIFTFLDPIRPNFELVRDLMDVIGTCKNEEDPIKNECARVFTTLYINFSDAQGR